MIGLMIDQDYLLTAGRVRGAQAVWEGMQVATTPTGGDVPDLAPNLSWLRRNVPDRDGDFYTYADLRDAILKVDPELRLSVGHLAALHRGQKTAVGARLLWRICEVYNVPFEFFWRADVREQVKIAVVTYGDLRRAAAGPTGQQES